MRPVRRSPPEDDTPLEGELLSARQPPALSSLGTRLIRLLRTLWLLGLAATAWLLWLSLGGEKTSVLDILLALVLAAPSVVLTLAMLGLHQLGSLLSSSIELFTAPLYGEDGARHGHVQIIRLQQTLNELRDQAEGLMLLAFLLTPGFLILLGMALIATLIMLPVALFTLLFALF